MARKKAIKDYGSALAELEEIVQAIDSDEVGVDKLAEEVKRASDLLIYCREKLRATQDEVGELLEEIED